MSYFITYQINDHIYQLKDPMGVLTTLVIGKDKAMLVDTAYGIGNLKQAISEITSLPLIVINSHGHMDHSCGNYQFDEVFINELDVDLCIKHNSRQKRIENLESADNLKLLDSTFNREKYLEYREGNLKIIDFDTIDLGGLTIKLVNLNGHTIGSIGFLIEEDNLLITSDAICPWVWMFLDESTTVPVYLKMLKDTMLLPFEGFLLGHGTGQIMPKDEILKYIKVTEDIDLDKSVKVSFNHFDNLNSYCYSEYKVHEAGKWGIIFNPDKLK